MSGRRFYENLNEHAVRWTIAKRGHHIAWRVQLSKARCRWTAIEGQKREHSAERRYLKYLFSSPDPARIGLAQSILDVEGIKWDVRNEAVSQTEVGLRFATELWVLHDEDYESARELIQSGLAER